VNEKAAKRIAADIARTMAMICVRNSRLEDLHAGQVPTTRTGDYSDVVVIDAEGKRIPWAEVSRINDDEMRMLMRDVVNRLYTFHLKSDDPGLHAQILRWMSVATRWDEPDLDTRMISSGNAADK
jgi:hypothetical protein